MLSFTLLTQLLLSICCLLVRADFQNYTGQISPPYSGAQIMNIGQINAVTLDDPTDILSGGTITVDGILFIVPRNSLLTTPQQVVLWSELWVDGVVQMPLWPEVGWEASVFANEVNGDLIAGMVFIEQESARFITGFISAINSTTGEFWIAGSANQQPGQRARLNDPIGRFGLAYTDNPLWAADTENPSITSISAMPLCIQRPFLGNQTDDPLCPTKNRPLRADGTAHTMITFLPEDERGPDDPDPNFFVPMAVGDYITVIGTMVDDDLLAVWNLVANIGIFTPAGEQPTYMYIDRGQYAIEGPALVEDGETRAVVFTTDVTTPITWSAIDLDPCTGAQTWRPLLTEQPLSIAPGQQPGKTVFRGGANDFSPAPRYIGFKTASGMKVTNNSIVAGVYSNPVNGFANGFIFAEVVVYGDQMFALEFNDMDFIAKGSGPYVEGVPLKVPMDNPPIIGQLDPWPGVNTPTAVVCAATPTGSAPATGTAAPTPTTTHALDVVTIISATLADRTRGETNYDVTVEDSVTEPPFPILTVTGQSLQNPVGAIQMVNLGEGMYTLSFATHSQLDSITVQSSFGGASVFTF